MVDTNTQGNWVIHKAIIFRDKPGSVWEWEIRINYTPRLQYSHFGPTSQLGKLEFVKQMLAIVKVHSSAIFVLTFIYAKTSS